MNAGTILVLGVNEKNKTEAEVVAHLHQPGHIFEAYQMVNKCDDCIKRGITKEAFETSSGG